MTEPCCEHWNESQRTSEIIRMGSRMKIQIEQDITGTGDYDWRLETGPENIDVYTGYCKTLGECFEEIIRSQTINAMEYVND